MAELLGKTIVGTWDEINNLEKETELLLKKVKGKNVSNKKKEMYVGAKNALSQGSPSKREKENLKSKNQNEENQVHNKKLTAKHKKSGKVLSLSLNSGIEEMAASMDKTRNLFSDSRMTVEVLDDASPDNSPRDVEDDKKRMKRMLQAQRQSLKQKQSKITEDQFRSINFDNEKTRVEGKRDLFFSAPGISADDVTVERERLTKLEESSRKLKKKLDDESDGVRVFLVKDKAVTKVQSLFRGHIGRQKFSLTKRLREIVDDEASDWIEVRDRESGDIWFYNKLNGESQWERPDDMFSKLSSKATLKILPVIKSGNKSLSQNSGYSLTIPSNGGSSNQESSSSNIKGNNMSVSMVLPTLEATNQSKSGFLETKNNKSVKFNDDIEALEAHRKIEAQAQIDIDKEMGIDNLNNGEKLGALDGYFKPQLRTTILDALLETRFDSVSTVLADKRWYESQEDPVLKQRKIVPTSVGAPLNPNVAIGSKSIRLNPNNKPMTAMMTFNQVDGSTKMSIDKNADVHKKEIDPLEQYKQEDLTMTDLEHPGFEEEVAKGNMCFGCWSAGLRKSCASHTDTNMKLKASQTMLLCRNWELGVQRRRYRAEEIQEVFLRQGSSLRYDNKRKCFYTTMEMKHQVYRAQTQLLEENNRKLILTTKVKRWLLSFVDEVRMGKTKTSKAAQRSAAVMRVRRSKAAFQCTEDYGKEIRGQLPVPPITGYSLAERKNEIHYLFKHPDLATNAEVELINVYPTRKSGFLYDPREYHRSLPRSIPMPRANMKAITDKNSHRQTLYIPENSPAAWLERLVSSTTRDCSIQAIDQIKELTPLPGLELLRRTKEPPPSTIKFATLGMKMVKGNTSIGGLPLELLIYQIITTYFPVQYGNFMVMDKSTISPGVSPEISITFPSVLMGPLTQQYNLRQLEHPLNYRRAPTISFNNNIKPDNKFFYGTNRPEQTGEQESHGFRTSVYSRYLEVEVKTDPQAFTPSSEVVSLNIPNANKSNVTHVDLTYPFCEPSTRDNSTLDFFHLLLTGAMSGSKPQVFTALTYQESGLFMKDCRTDLPMGHLVTTVYRSWAFTQKDTIEEFKTDDGVAYWYHRRTGQTFWERPLYQEEELSPLEGGTILDTDHPEMPLLISKGLEMGGIRYKQGDFRKSMLTHHESDLEAETRRESANFSATQARLRGTLPDNPRQLAGTGNSIHGIEGSIEEEQQQDNFDVSQSRAATANSSNNGGIGPAAFGIGDLSLESSGLPPSSPSRQGTATTNQSRPSTGSRPPPSAFGGSKLGSMLESDEVTQPGGGKGDEVHTIENAPILPGVDGKQMLDLTQNLGKMMMGMMTNGASAQEMVGLGMSMGMTLLQTQVAQGQAENTVGRPIPGVVERRIGSASEHELTNLSATDFPSLSEEEFEEKSISQSRVSSPSRTSSKPGSKQLRIGNEPIGVVNPTQIISSIKDLDRTEEHQQMSQYSELINRPLNSFEKARNLVVQPALPSVTPDEAPPKHLTHVLPKDAEEAMSKTVPVLVYPELSTCTPGGAPQEANTHEAAGINTSYVPHSEGDKQTFVKGAVDPLRRVVMPLPVGFFAAIVAKHSAKQEVDYLPQVPNLPESRTVGRVKPRSSAMDWLAVNFDPWSAGKSPLNVEFVGSLNAKAENLFRGKAPGEVLDALDTLRAANSDGAPATLDDVEGIAKQRQDITKAQVLAQDYKKICSLVRHGKFGDVEELLNQPEWSVPIDYQDDMGNSLMHFATQNGNKRMVKLCLRRGSALNLQNLLGQTPLHFAYGYGYAEVGDYLINKGADDTIKNKDGLTCYEGLGARELMLL
jgi:hypothetical protein